MQYITQIYSRSKNIFATRTKHFIPYGKLNSKTSCVIIVYISKWAYYQLTNLERCYENKHYVQ